MKTYEEALLITVEAVRKDGGDFRTSYRFGAYNTLANIYDVSIKQVYEDGAKLDLVHEVMQNEARRATARAENEARRQANIEAGGKNREPKQRRMDLGV